jgi:hypothetical protein
MVRVPDPYPGKLATHVAFFGPAANEKLVLNTRVTVQVNARIAFLIVFAPLAMSFEICC